MKNLNPIWRDIDKAGGINPFIEQELRSKGFFVERRDTEKMSKKELNEYKISLKKEASERRELKKKTWKAYFQTHISYLGEGVYWQDENDLDPWDVEHPEKRLASMELPVLESPKQVAEALSITIPQLRGLASHRDAADYVYYHRFAIPKRSGGMRNIWAPVRKLKTIQRWVLDHILQHFPVHSSAHGFLPERSILTHAQNHTHSSCIVRIDLQDFFPSVTLPRVKGVFRKAGYREQIATLLALLCTEAPREVISHEGKALYVSLGPRCLPQGAPTSPALSNIVSLRLDRRLTGLAKAHGWRYSRYADDLTFSFPEQSKEKPKIGALIGFVSKVAQEEGFQVNTKKTWVSRKGGKQQVTGLIVNGKGNPRTNRELKRMLRAAIHNLQQGKTNPLNTIPQLIGYAAFVAMAEPEKGQAFLKALTPFSK